ncbi:MAG: AIPR family protein [Candidatus Micrarchaeota archaeon]
MAIWKDLFLQEIEDIVSKFKVKDYRAFLFWYLKASEDLPDSEIWECITDRPKDAGSDAVVIDYTQKNVKIIQSKFTKEIGSSPFDKDELTKTSKIYEYLSGKEDFYKIRDYIHTSLREKLDKALLLIKEQGYTLKFFFITTHRMNPHYEIYLPSDMRLELISSREIERKYEEWRHGHTPELGEVELDFENIVEGPGVPKSYIVNIRAEVLRKAYLKWKEKLFSRNVRIFYGTSKKANTAMKLTLNKEPKNFWYFNNGVTILSEKATKNASKIILKNPQIINGCQTVSTIGELAPNIVQDALIFAKIIEIGDELINQNFIDTIIEANNRQTPVDERILKSNHPLQVRLQRKLEDLGYYFERKEGQYKQERGKSRRIASLECIKNIELLRANTAIVKAPHSAQANEDDLFTSHFNDVFKENKTAIDYLLPYLVWRLVSYIGKNYRGKKRQRFHKYATFHVLRLIYDDTPDITNSLKMHDIGEKLRENFFEFDEEPVRKLFDIAYQKFDKSEYSQIPYGERDYFRVRSSYDDMKDAVPKHLKYDLERLFE